jgi:hypothetical protein
VVRVEPPADDHFVLVAELDEPSLPADDSLEPLALALVYSVPPPADGLSPADSELPRADWQAESAQDDCSAVLQADDLPVQLAADGWALQEQACSARPDARSQPAECPGDWPAMWPQVDPVAQRLQGGLWSALRV